MYKQRILLVYGDPAKSVRIENRLDDIGFHCFSTPHATEPADELLSDQYAAMIVHQDAMIGLTEFCRNWRKADSNLLIVPVLARHDERLDLELLNCGADDVVTDQHCPAAVAKRVSMRVVSKQTLNFEYDTIRIGEALVDFPNGLVERSGKHIPLSIRDSKLLKYLIANAGRTVSRRSILHWVWRDAIVDPVGKNVDVYVARLRKVLEKEPKKPIHIKTVFGIGYRFDPSVTDARKSDAADRSIKSSS